MIFSIPRACRAAGGSLVNAWRKNITVSDIPDYFENSYNSFFSGKEISLDIFSITQRCLGKREVRNFEVLKDKDGTLYLQGNDGEVDFEFIEAIADEYEMIYKETEKYGGNFIFVQCPYKNVEQAKDLKSYSSDNMEESEDYLLQLMRDRNIPVLDLREYAECKYTYKTDHHWTVESAFNASSIITREIDKAYKMGLADSEFYGNMENYTAVTYEKCFLGSIGIKVGPYYTGRDDFTVYNPKFDTDFDFKHYINDELSFEYTGDFWNTFVNQEMLEDSKYNNKYDANMHGAYAESVIINNQASNNYKGLLITHSYGRSMGQYFCMNFKELRYLDPQRGRYNGDYIEYVKSYQPDVVVLMYNGMINVGDGTWE